MSRECDVKETLGLLQIMADAGFTIVDLARTNHPLPRREINATSCGGYLHIFPAENERSEITVDFQFPNRKLDILIDNFCLTSSVISFGFTHRIGGNYYPHRIYPTRNISVEDTWRDSRDSNEYMLKEILSNSKKFRFDSESRLYLPE